MKRTPWQALGLLLLALQSACAYTAPFRRTAAGEAARRGPDTTVVVTLSAVEHRAGQRAAFFRDTKAVLAELPAQPGLLGYSFRFELFGRRAWTMTAWTDVASRDRFVRSPAHLAAMRNSPVTTTATRFVTFTLPAQSLPPPWSAALRKLENTPANTVPSAASAPAY